MKSEKLQNAIGLIDEELLEDAQKYYPDVNGESILLQGVVDCAMIEENGITIIDFKSDYITESNLSEKIAHYTVQVQTYANAEDLDLESAYDLITGNDEIYEYIDSNLTIEDIMDKISTGEIVLENKKIDESFGENLDPEDRWIEIYIDVYMVDWKNG